MLHEISMDGCAFRLRPVSDEDAAFVVQLRSDTNLNRYLHPVSGRPEDQLAWQKAYYARRGDYYFVVERRENSQPEGLIAIYDVDERSLSAEWGRWILKQGSLAAVESAWLIYRIGFESLHLKRIFCRTVADNGAVVSFHDSCGLERRLLGSHFSLNGNQQDAVEHSITAENWKAVESRLQKLAQVIARRVNRE